MGREEEEHIKAPLIIGISQEYGDGDGGGVFEEVKKQLWLAGPLICVSLLQYSLQLISIMFVGHLGELSLSGASMATSFATVTGFSLFMGMACALDTLCGQSYGAKQYHMLGIYMQRAMVILMVVSIPVALIWLNTGLILKAVGQDPGISEEAGAYARFMLPSLFAYALLQCLVRFLQTQNIVFPMMVSSGIATLLHVLICWLLVFKSGLGTKGAALANSISYWNNVILLGLYVKFSSSCAKTWTGFSREAIHGILPFIKLAIPSAVMVCLEMWSFELIVLLSGLLPHPELETSVLSICLNTAAVVWMIPFGLSGAVRDRWICSGGPKEEFTVSWFRKEIVKKRNGQVIGGCVWNKWAPIKINIFVWRCFRKRIAVKEVILSMGINSTSTQCDVCKGNSESINHIFVDCPSAEQVWSKVKAWWGLNRNFGDCLVSVFEWLMTGAKSRLHEKILQLVGFASIHMLWKNRNECVFENKSRSPEELFVRIQNDVFLWVSNRAKKVDLDRNRWFSNPSLAVKYM